AKADRLTPIDGSPPDLFAPPAGCGYCARCPYAMQVCRDQEPPAFDVEPNHYARCWLHHDSAPRTEPALYYAATRARAAESSEQ
ncbi:MAG: oligopeptide/dipeptide ABC transporter ATP-binding protein, partial [Pseudomonadales bacterium]